MAEKAEATASYREGDWYCEKCGDHQFERNLMCRKCGNPKPMVSSNNIASKEGDWICPNPACKDLQFERNMVCRKCSTPRPYGAPGKGGGLPPAGKGAAAAFARPVPVPGGSGQGVFAPEDWMCPACGDHQFAKNVVCRRCGGPKPGAAGKGGAVPKAGDWICPNPQCKDLQFERNTQCRKCGTAKPAPGSTSMVARPTAAPRSSAVKTFYNTSAPPPRALGELSSPLGQSAAAPPKNMAPEDWICANCGDHQFARNIACRKCSAPKPVTSANGQTAKMGDWICPNPACKDVQFERNHICRKCGTAKPFGTPTASGGWSAASPMGYAAPVAGAYGAGAYGAGAYGAGAYGGRPMIAGGRPMRPGDWACPSCRDIQFEKNEKCRLCGTEKPTVATNKQVFKAGDWICPNPECKDVQFERNTVCRRCGTAKPDDAGRTRSRSPARTPEVS